MYTEIILISMKKKSLKAERRFNQSLRWVALMTPGYLNILDHNVYKPITSYKYADV